MRKGEYGDYIQDILDSAEAVEEFIEGMTQEAFAKIKRLFLL